MSIGSQIACYRKRLKMTQDTLAQKLDVTNQAVSKWESDQCCPDILLLPKLADIFCVTIDALFERQSDDPVTNTSLPWEDDNTLHVVVYQGRSLVGESEALKELTFQYEGPALNIECALNLSCESVGGSAQANGSISCDSVGGSVNAGGSVTCDSVGGNIHAGGSVTCDDVDGDVHAGGNISCDCIEGNADAGGNITCDEINGNATAKGNIYCDEINVESEVFGPEQGQETGGSNVHIHQDGKSVNTEKNGRFSFIFGKNR